ncbi:ETC complex I subunit conserved region-domain-containing protein [Gongronella butleri]|nr:ETC complex I subunit conserved region-domain-containing protein [Gongronella butleri]
MFFTRALRQAATKVTTGLTGVPVQPNARPMLIETYNSTLTVLSRLPATAAYRQATESITKSRLAIVESTESHEEIEAKIGGNFQIEELLMQAEDELKLSAKMEQWKPWEELEVPIPEGQWKYPGNKE